MSSKFHTSYNTVLPVTSTIKPVGYCTTSCCYFLAVLHKNSSRCCNAKLSVLLLAPIIFGTLLYQRDGIKISKMCDFLSTTSVFCFLLLFLYGPPVCSIINSLFSTLIYSFSKLASRQFLSACKRRVKLLSLKSISILYQLGNNIYNRCNVPPFSPPFSL